MSEDRSKVRHIYYGDYKFRPDGVHTPLPWKYINVGAVDKDGFPSHWHKIVHAEHNWLVLCMDDFYENDNLDAQFIVRACNAHYDLLQACRDAHDRVEHALAPHPAGSKPDDCQLCSAIVKAEK